MSLKILQENFQASILIDDISVLKKLVAPIHLSEADSMSIYRNGYFQRIIQAMMQDFPQLCAHLGEAAFAGLVCDYLENYPPTDFNLRYVGKNLADFILSRDPAFAPYAELARAEWAACVPVMHNSSD